jgi:RNA recognition motif-containing protein
MLSAESTTTLIVDGLALFTTAADLQAMFTPFGSVVSCRIVVDHCSNSLRYGYVVMDSADHADNAIKALNGQASAGLPITVAHVATVPSLPRVQL